MRAGLLAWAAASALLALEACRTLRGEEEVPAVIESPTAATRAVLQRAVSEALGGAPVLLADDALTRSSILVVERVRPRDASGMLLGGREHGMPERFRLVRSGRRCILVHEADRRRLALEATRCSPLPPGS